MVSAEQLKRELAFLEEELIGRDRDQAFLSPGFAQAVVTPGSAVLAAVLAGAAAAGEPPPAAACPALLLAVLLCHQPQHAALWDPADASAVFEAAAALARCADPRLCHYALVLFSEHAFPGLFAPRAVAETVVAFLASPPPQPESMDVAARVAKRLFKDPAALLPAHPRALCDVALSLLPVLAPGCGAPEDAVREAFSAMCAARDVLVARDGVPEADAARLQGLAVAALPRFLPAIEAARREGRWESMLKLWGPCVMLAGDALMSKECKEARSALVSAAYDAMGLLRGGARRAEDLASALEAWGFLAGAVLAGHRRQRGQHEAVMSVATMIATPLRELAWHTAAARAWSHAVRLCAAESPAEAQSALVIPFLDDLLGRHQGRAPAGLLSSVATYVAGLLDQTPQPPQQPPFRLFGGRGYVNGVLERPVGLGLEDAGALAALAERLARAVVREPGLSAGDLAAAVRLVRSPSDAGQLALDAFNPIQGPGLVLEAVTLEPRAWGRVADAVLDDTLPVVSVTHQVRLAFFLAPVAPTALTQAQVASLMAALELTEHAVCQAVLAAAGPSHAAFKPHARAALNAIAASLATQQQQQQQQTPRRQLRQGQAATIAKALVAGAADSHAAAPALAVLCERAAAIEDVATLWDLLRPLGLAAVTLAVLRRAARLPKTDPHFLSLTETLHPACEGLHGPMAKEASDIWKQLGLSSPTLPAAPPSGGPPRPPSTGRAKRLFEVAAGQQQHQQQQQQQPQPQQPPPPQPPPPIDHDPAPPAPAPAPAPFMYASPLKRPRPTQESPSPSILKRPSLGQAPSSAPSSNSVRFKDLPREADHPKDLLPTLRELVHVATEDKLSTLDQDDLAQAAKVCKELLARLEAGACNKSQI